MQSKPGFIGDKGGGGEKAEEQGLSYTNQSREQSIWVEFLKKCDVAPFPRGFFFNLKFGPKLNLSHSSFSSFFFSWNFSCTTHTHLSYLFCQTTKKWR